MDLRFFAILGIVCFALVDAGCASKAQRRGNEEAVLLPRQTGSNLVRRIRVDDESSLKEKKRRDLKRSSKKRVKTERTEPARREPEQPEETATPPDRFR